MPQLEIGHVQHTCPYDPLPVQEGMFHCPVCGCMILGLCEHGEVVSGCCEAQINFTLIAVEDDGKGLVTSRKQTWDCKCAKCSEDTYGDYPSPTEEEWYQIAGPKDRAYYDEHGQWPEGSLDTAPTAEELDG